MTAELRIFTAPKKEIDDSFSDQVDFWSEAESKFFKLSKDGFDFYRRRCCSGRSPILGKMLTVSVYGAPPYVTVDWVALKVGGIDLGIVS